MHTIELNRDPDQASQGNAESTTFQNRGISSSSVSSPLRLGVATIAAEDGRFPTPAIDEATGDELNLWTFQGDAHVTLGPWPFMSAGQRVWLDVIDASGGFPIVANDAVTSSDLGKALIYPIDRDSLERLADDTALRFEPR